MTSGLGKAHRQPEDRMTAADDSKDPLKPFRSGGLHWLGIMAVAVVLQFSIALAFFRLSPVPPLTSWGFEDIAIALSIHAGHGFGSPFFTPTGPTAFMAPGYPLLIAGVMQIFGTGSFAATILIVLQSVFFLVSVIAVMYTAQLHFGNRIANLAGFVCVLCPPLLMAPLKIWDTSLSALLLAGFVAATSGKWISRRSFIPAGAACAIAGLINPCLIPAVFALCALAAWRIGKFPWKGILAFLLVFFPWPARNAVVLHQFVPLRTDFGFELWMGNHPGADGNFHNSLGPMLGAAARKEYVGLGELAYMHRKRVLAEAYIESHPEAFLRLSVRRAGEFWTGSEAGSNPTTAPILVLALAGFLLLCWKRRDLLPIYGIPLLLFPLPYYITHVDARFQAAIDPIMAILAGYGVASCIDLITGVSRDNAEIHTFTDQPSPGAPQMR